MQLNPAVKDIFGFRYEDFTVEDYEPHPHIKARGGGVSLAIRAARPADAALIFALVRELADYEKLHDEVDGDAGGDRRRAVCAASRGCSATSPNGTASRRASRSGFSIFRPFAAATAFISRICSCGRRFAASGIGKALMARLAQALRRAGLRALRMGGARLERAVDRVLQVDRRAGDGRVAHLPAERRRPCRISRPSDGRGMKIVLVAAIGENDVIGRDGQLPWRLKSDLRAFPCSSPSTSRW